MRSAIYGAGSLGTVMGAYLTREGVQVDLINRNHAHVDALNKSGAHITGTVDMTVPVNALLPEDMTGKYDIIFLKRSSYPRPCCASRPCCMNPLPPAPLLREHP